MELMEITPVDNSNEFDSERTEEHLLVKLNVRI